MKTSQDGLSRRARWDLEKAVHIVQVEFAEAIAKDPRARTDASQQIHDYAPDEVAWIAKRVEHLEDLAGTICRERLASLAEAAGES